MLARASSDSAIARTARCRFMPHSLRSAAKPECISAEIERAWARLPGIWGPQFLFGKFFREVFEDRKRIPDRDIAVDQRRHLAGERKAEDAVLVRLVVGIERDEPLVEGDGIGAQPQPWP